MDMFDKKISEALRLDGVHRRESTGTGPVVLNSQGGLSNGDAS